MILEVTIARELLPYDLHLDYINYLLITKRTHRCEHCPNFASFNSFESKHWFTSKANQLDIQLVHHILQNIKVANINKAFVHIKDFFTPVLLDQNTDVDLIYI